SGSGDHQRFVVAPPGGGESTALPYHPAPPIPQAATLSAPRQPQGAFLIGRVRSPLHTSAGIVRPRTALGDPTWLLILRHHGRHGVALVPTSGEPRAAAVDLKRLELRWTRVRIQINLRRLRLELLRGRHVLGAFPIA